MRAITRILANKQGMYKPKLLIIIKRTFINTN